MKLWKETSHQVIGELGAGPQVIGPKRLKTAGILVDALIEGQGFTRFRRATPQGARKLKTLEEDTKISSVKSPKLKLESPKHFRHLGWRSTTGASIATCNITIVWVSRESH